MKILAALEKSKQFWFLLCISLFFFFLRFPSLFEPYWYGDEGIYQVLAKGMLDGRLLYEGIWDNKPPLLYVLYALFGGDQFALRILSLLFGLTTINVFFFLTKKLFQTNNSVPLGIYGVAALFALLLGIPYLEGNIANAENFILLPITLAGLLIYRNIHLKLEIRNWKLEIFLSGLLLGLAFLIKIVAIFDTAAFLLFFFFMQYKPEKTLFTSIQKTIPLFLGFLIPITITTLFFIVNGAFDSFYKATFLQNIGYVNYGNDLLIPQGFLILKLLFLGAATLWLFWKRNVVSSSTIFILLWFFYSMFNAFFSQRPYTHYLLVMLPSFCLFICLLLEEKKYKKFYLLLFTISTILLYNNFHLYKKNIPYYQNFISFMRQEKSVVAYQSFFDKNTPKDYEIVRFIKSHTKPDDQIFLWSNSAQIYALTNKLPPGRYTVAYHMTTSDATLKETAEALYKTQPKYIIINNKQGEQFPFGLTGYTLRLTLNDNTIYERIN